MVLCLSIGRKRIRIMNEENSRGGPAALATRHLCTVEFEVGGGIIGIGASPFGDQRLGYISGGRFFGPRINGIVLPGGGDGKSVVWGKSVSVRVDLGGRRIIKK